MRVETTSYTTYYFTQEEVDYLHDMGIWSMFCLRLKDNEGFKIE